MAAIVGRSQEKSEATAQEIKDSTGNPNIAYLLADLSSIKQVQRLANEFLSRYSRLDVLVNNAGGVFFSPTRNQPFDVTRKRHINPWDYPVD